jgi:hypothetical protein
VRAPISSRAEAVLWQLVLRSFLLGSPGRDPEYPAPSRFFRLKRPIPARLKHESFVVAFGRGSQIPAALAVSPWRQAFITY